MTEPFADDLYRDALLDEEAAVGVAEVVESDGRDAGVVDDPPEGLVDGVRMDRVAVTVGEHPLLAVVDPDRFELCSLEGAPPCEHRKRGRIELDVPPRRLRLASRLLDLVANRDESSVEVEAPL